jgi:hypothetical protein
MFPHPNKEKGERSKVKGAVENMKKAFLQGEGPLDFLVNT